MKIDRGDIVCCGRWIETVVKTPCKWLVGSFKGGGAFFDGSGPKHDSKHRATGFLEVLRGRVVFCVGWV